MSFDEIMYNQNIVQKQNCVSWIHTSWCFIVNIKTGNVSKDIAEDVETSFATSSYELDKPLPKGKIKSNYGKNELGEKIMTKFFGFVAKTYS